MGKQEGIKITRTTSGADSMAAIDLQIWQKEKYCATDNLMYMDHKDNIL